MPNFLAMTNRSINQHMLEKQAFLHTAETRISFATPKTATLHVGSTHKSQWLHLRNVLKGVI